MNRSSISSSERAVGPPWSLFVALLLLFGLELVLRALNPKGLLPSTEDRELAYREIVPQLDTFGAPEIAIIGSSRARRGAISPLLRRLLKREDMDVRVGNFALAGGQAEEVELTVRLLVEASPPPRLLLWPISPRELEERANRPVSTVRFLWRPRDWWLARKSVGKKADAYLPDAIRSELARHCWVMRHRFAMRDLVDNPPRRHFLQKLRDTFVPPPRAPTPIQGGIHPKLVGRERYRTIDIDRKRVRRYVGGAYDDPNWPRNYQAEHLDGAMATARRAGIPLLLIELPPHELLEEVMPPGTSAKFRSHLRATVPRHGATFVSAAELETSFERRDFHEQSHLNYPGAEKFTKAIAPFVAAELRGSTKTPSAR